MVISAVIDPFDLQEETGEASRRSLNIATARTFDVLSQFVLKKPEFGVTELSRELGMTKNMIYRALATLVDHNLLMRDEGGRKYQLSYRILEFQNPHFPSSDIRTLAHPYLERLHQLMNRTIQLSVPAGDGQVVIDGVEGHGVMVKRSKISQYFPLHASAASRAILSCLSDAEIDAYIKRNSPLPAFTETTITTRKGLFTEVSEIRERGYAVTIEDFFKGTSGISFPIVAADGSPHCAVTVSGATQDQDAETYEETALKALPIISELRAIGALYDRI